MVEKYLVLETDFYVSQNEVIDGVESWESDQELSANDESQNA